MRVVVTSDFHWAVPPVVPRCDLLIVAGDVLGGGWSKWPPKAHSRPHGELQTLAEWLQRAPAGEIVGIAGNHDFIAREEPALVRALPWRYLEDEGATVCGLRVWGSPMAVQFGGWAFMAPDDKLAPIFKRIPKDTELLVVHGPAHGILDRVSDGRRVGSHSLRRRLSHLPDLQLLATGHIHEARGQVHAPIRRGGQLTWLHCVNASLIGPSFGLADGRPVVIDL